MTFRIMQVGGEEYCTDKWDSTKKAYHRFTLLQPTKMTTMTTMTKYG